MQRYLNKHRKFLGTIGSVISLLIAIVYLILTPQESSNTNGIQQIILIYGHSACWMLLAAASFLWALREKNKWSTYLAYSALATYIIFMGTLLLNK